MKRLFGNVAALACAALVIVSVTDTARADLLFEVRASSAPNVFGSPSWPAPGYVANALNSLENGLGNIGNRNTDPTAYEIAGAFIEPGDIIVSGFNSWRAVAGAPAPFHAEYGNRLHFGLHITGGGTEPQFRLNDLLFQMESTDTAMVLNFGGNFNGLGYNANRYGIDYGPDRMKGGGDDILYTTGNGLSLVDEIVYVGVGNAFDATFEPGATNQDKINSVLAYIASEAPFDIYTTYKIYDPTGTIFLGAGGDVVTVPTPAALAVFGIGLAVLGRRRARS